MRCIWSLIPADLQGAPPFQCLPYGISDDGYTRPRVVGMPGSSWFVRKLMDHFGSLDLDYISYAWNGFRFRGAEGPEFAAEDRATLDRSVKHPRNFDIDSIDRASIR